MTEELSLVRSGEELAALPPETGAFRGDDLTDGDLEAVRRLPDLTTVHLDGCTRLGDDALAHLAAAPQLRVLYVTGDRITDHGLRAIGRMGSLEELGLDAPITGEGLPHLAGATRLRELHLPAMRRLEGERLADLTSLPALRDLCIYNVPTMVDSWLRAIGRIGSLRTLVLMRCPGVTETGLGALRTERPDLRISVD